MLAALLSAAARRRSGIGGRTVASAWRGGSARAPRAPPAWPARAAASAAGASFTKKRANELRVGAVVSLDGGSTLGVIEKYAYTQGSGRQLGVVQATLRTVGGAARGGGGGGGGTVQARWRPGDDVAVARLEERACTLLYRDGGPGGARGDFVLMDGTDFEQVAVPASLLPPVAAALLPDGAAVTLTLGPDGSPVAAAPAAPTVEVTVAEAPPARTGAAPGLKVAVTATGATVKVPNHVSAGDTIVVNTTDGSFVRRV